MSYFKILEQRIIINLKKKLKDFENRFLLLTFFHVTRLKLILHKMHSIA